MMRTIRLIVFVLGIFGAVSSMRAYDELLELSDSSAVQDPVGMVYVSAQVCERMQIIARQIPELQEFASTLSEGLVSCEQAYGLVDALEQVLQEYKDRLSAADYIDLMHCCIACKEYVYEVQGTDEDATRKREFNVMLDLWVQHALRAGLLTVDGPAQVGGNLDVGCNLNVGRGGHFSCDVIIDGNLIVNETIIVDKIIVESTECANSCGENPDEGAVIIEGGVKIKCNVVICDEENSTSCDTGALVVAGGVGIGKDLYVCGTGHFSNLVATGAYLFSYDTTQQVVGSLAFQSITFDTDVVLEGWIKATPETFVCQKSGFYRIDYNADVALNGAAISGQTAIIALLNGVEVPGSYRSTYVDADEPVILANSFIVEVAAGDLLVFQMTGSNNGCTLSNAGPGNALVKPTIGVVATKLL